MPPTPESDARGMSHWRFDAVDLRAGMAFAAWRKDLAHDPLPVEVQAVYFSPPSFIPEPVANVALALGATRGSLRPGLMVEGREAWFRTLEEAGEFLRRAYLASGGGDGGDGTGEGDPSPPLPDPPDLPSQPEGEIEFDEVAGTRERKVHAASRTLVHLAAALKSQTSRLEAGSSLSFSWGKLEESDGLADLLAGATHVLRELLMRGPRVADYEDEHLRWITDFKCWWAAVGQLGLRPLLFTTNGRGLRPLLQAWSQQFPWTGLPPPYERDPSLVVASILHGGDRVRHLIDVYWWWRHHLPSSSLMPLWQSPDSRSPAALSTDTMRRLPLPPWAWPLVGSDLQGRASLYHLLCTLTARPQLTAEPRHFQLVLFACACVAAGQHSTSTELPVWDFDDDFAPSLLEIGEARRNAQEAIAWLKEHLPALGFSEGYEDAISGAKDARYRG